MNDKEMLERLEKSIASLTESVGELSLKIKELDERTSFPINKSLDKASEPMKRIRAIEDHFKLINYGATSDIGNLSLKIKDKKPILKHYYEDGMPKLEKYLAYLEIVSGSCYGGTKLFLIPIDCEISFTLIRKANHMGNCVRVDFHNVINTLTFKKNTVQFRFDAVEKTHFGYLDSVSKTFKMAIDALSNNSGGDLNIESIYGTVKNQFRTIRVVSWQNTTVTIENTVYSSYGCMEENKPLFADSIFLPATIHIYN